MKDQLASIENGYYAVIDGAPPTLVATGDTIEAEGVIPVSQGDRNEYTAWALIGATNRSLVRQDVRNYSLKSVDTLKHLWQVLQDVTATVGVTPNQATGAAETLRSSACLCRTMRGSRAPRRSTSRSAN